MSEKECLCRHTIKPWSHCRTDMDEDSCGPACGYAHAFIHTIGGSCSTHAHWEIQLFLHLLYFSWATYWTCVTAQLKIGLKTWNIIVMQMYCLHADTWFVCSYGQVTWSHAPQFWAARGCPMNGPRRTGDGVQRMKDFWFRLQSFKRNLWRQTHMEQQWKQSRRLEMNVQRTQRCRPLVAGEPHSSSPLYPDSPWTLNPAIQQRSITSTDEIQNFLHKHTSLLHWLFFECEHTPYSGTLVAC